MDVSKYTPSWGECSHTYIHTNTVNTHSHTQYHNTVACAHTHTPHARTPTHDHTHTHTRPHTHPHTHTPTHTPTHTHPLHPHPHCSWVTVCTLCSGSMPGHSERTPREMTRTSSTWADCGVDPSSESDPLTPGGSRWLGSRRRRSRPETHI